MFAKIWKNCMVVKMKTKIIVLFLILFATCGCTVNYDLIIDNNGYYESTSIKSSGNEEVTKEELYTNYNYEYPIYYSEEFRYYNPTEIVSGNTYYTKSIVENKYGYEAKYKAKFNDINAYSDSRMVNSTFGNVNISYDEQSKHYFIKLSNIKLFKEEESITTIYVNIELSSNYTVINNNAYKIDNNTYSWKFNSISDNLILEYCNKDVYKGKTNVNNDSDNTIIIISIGFLAFALFIFIIIKLKRGRTNEK